MPTARLVRIGHNNNNKNKDKEEEEEDSLSWPTTAVAATPTSTPATATPTATVTAKGVSITFVCVLIVAALLVIYFMWVNLQAVRRENESLYRLAHLPRHYGGVAADHLLVTGIETQTTAVTTN